MHLVFGGAWQGKLTYVKETYGLGDNEIYTCGEDGEIDFSKRCIRHLEEYVLACMRQGKEPELALRPDAILICRDISCGIVPMDPEIRAWREATGRVVNGLASRCERVSRIFCGLAQELK